MVRNAKAKIRRTNKNYGVDLTGEIKIPNIGNIETREQFKKFKDDVKAFTNRNNSRFQFKKNDYGVVANKRELNEIARNTKRAQDIADRFNTKISKQPEIKQRMAQMARPENATGVSRPNDFDFSKIQSGKRLKEIAENMKKRADEKFVDERMEKFRDIYMEMISKTFNNEADELIEKFKDMPIDDFYELYLMNLQDMDIDWYYTDELGSNHLEKLSSIVEKYEEGQVNMDLKGF